ncbi:uncharacterized protein LOC111368312 [Olea europaea var. sylvestris]|uniref:uncharacterized protein LOC111368312 n=1 Tax=Olea europaea var. sylvestris TaxID=158386 RepID=UPI000C1D0E78|nr:uncharacterized protein LOC111368312 [Olea europaea var. sylvestris]
MSILHCLFVFSKLKFESPWSFFYHLLSFFFPLKVLHNIVIVESIRDGRSDPKGLIEILENVKKLSEKLARSSGGNFEAFGYNGSNTTAGTERSNMAHQFSSSPVASSDEFDTSVTTFNVAVIWFHLHEYAKSFSILDTLYQHIEPIDEGLLFLFAFCCWMLHYFHIMHQNMSARRSLVLVSKN